MSPPLTITVLPYPRRRVCRRLYPSAPNDRDTVHPEIAVHSNIDNAKIRSDWRTASLHGRDVTIDGDLTGYGRQTIEPRTGAFLVNKAPSL